MKLSIIIPVLESHEIVRRQLLYLSRLIRYNQFTDLEVFFIDDGSEKPIVDYINKGDDFYFYKIRENLFRCYTENFYIFETHDKQPWSQPRAKNSVSKIIHGEYMLTTDIDHILTAEALENLLTQDFDKMIFSRKYGYLDYDGTLFTERDKLLSLGYKNEYIDIEDVHSHTFCIKKSVFTDQLHGYDESYCGKYGHDDTEFHKRFNALNLTNVVNGGRMWVMSQDAIPLKGCWHNSPRNEMNIQP